MLLRKHVCACSACGCGGHFLKPCTPSSARCPLSILFGSPLLTNRSNFFRRLDVDPLFDHSSLQAFWKNLVCQDWLFFLLPSLISLFYILVYVILAVLSLSEKCFTDAAHREIMLAISFLRPNFAGQNEWGICTIIKIVRISHSYHHLIHHS